LQRLEWANLKKTIIVVILAALILAALPVFTIPNAKASASEAKVLSYSYYTAGANSVLASKTGDLVVVGEVQNVGSGIINNVTVTGTAYNSNGTELGSAEGLVFVFEMTPGQKAPFSIDIPSLSSTNTNPYWASSVSSVTISVLSVTDTSTAPYTGLTVPQQPTSFNNSGTYETVGTIVNNGSETVGYLWVVTTFYNSAGTVVGLNFTDYLITPSAPLYQGHPTRWVATPADNTATLTNEIASSAYVIDTIPYSSSTQNQNTPTPTATGSSSPFPLLPVVVVVVIIVVAVVALMLLRKRPEAQPPPPPPPPPMP
jgi:hypothetical protein